MLKQPSLFPFSGYLGCTVRIATVAMVLCATLSAEFLPQVVFGTTWKTTIILRNNSAAQTGTVHLRCLHDASAEIVLPIVTADGQHLAASSYDFAVPPKGTTVVSSDGQNDNVIECVGVITSDVPISVHSVLTQTLPGKSDVDTAVSATTSGSKLIIPFDNRNGSTTGIAYSCLYDGYSDIEIDIFDASGKRLVQNLESSNTPWHRTLLLTSVYPVTAGIAGSIEITRQRGSHPTNLDVLIGFALRVSPTGAFTTMPAVVSSEN